jgi:hypothetical protein
MAGYNKFNQTIADVFNKVHDFSSDTVKAYLTNATPDSSDAVKTDVAEISAGNGYTAGGVALTVTSSTQTGGTYSVAVDTTPIVLTASGGSIGPFRYLVSYNDTAASDNLISYYDYGSAITVADGENFTITPSSTLFTAS